MNRKKRIILISILILILSFSLVSADTFNRTTNKWELTPEEYDSLTSQTKDMQTLNQAQGQIVERLDDVLIYLDETKTQMVGVLVISILFIIFYIEWRFSKLIESTTEKIPYKYAWEEIEDLTTEPKKPKEEVGYKRVYEYIWRKIKKLLKI